MRDLAPALLALVLAAPAWAQPPLIRGVTPSRGSPGTLVKIVGERLGDLTAVQFNGRDATFRVVSDFHIKALVPEDASSGPIRVTNAQGSAASLRAFVVLASDPLDGAPALGPPHPNPTRDRVSCRLTLGHAAPVRIAILDVRGAVIRKWVPVMFEPGIHDLTWDLRDGRGREVGAGRYFMRVDAGGVPGSRTLVVAR
jgi:hypothetical protein